jgi:transglutaminase-like putative cysteine protease
MLNKLYLKNYNNLKNLILFLILFCHTIFGQNKLAVPSKIADNLDALVRYDNSELIIESNKSYIYKHNWAVTVFNEIGENEFATFSVGYDKFTSIKKIEGYIYDATGKELKKLKRDDIKDIGVGSYGDEISDNRMKTAEFDKKYYPYPYTVAFSYEEQSSNMLFLPGWAPVQNDKIVVEDASFTISYPNEINLRKKEFYLQSKSIETLMDLSKKEVWTLKNYTAPKIENYTFLAPVPAVIIAPINFIIEDFAGEANNWANLASFYHSLNLNRDKLPETTIAEVAELVKNEKTTEQKVKKVYEYVQSKTRYQSIQLGIGGWQTRLAKEVAEKGYGDCKALTNYTVALLRSQKIEAYPALIKAGENAIFSNEDMPRMSFNHVIACVPMPKDTIWLECTSQDNPFGYQGDFTGNRKALLIKPEKGGLVNTIAYKPEQNLLIRKATVAINENGDSKISLNNYYSGIQYDFRAHLYKTKSPKEQKEWLVGRYQLPNIEIVKNTFTVKNTKLPELTEAIEIASNKLGSVTGKRMFIKPNMFANNTEPPAPDSTRLTELYLNPNSENYIDVDSIAIALPQNYKIETIPKEFTIKYIFGEYNTKIKVSADNTILVYHRKLKVQGGHYPKERYADWIEFLKKIKSNDRQKVVLVKKET